VTLFYSAADRSYSVVVANWEVVPAFLGYPRKASAWATVDEFDFCPWTGSPLPEDIKMERIDVIENELGLDYGEICDEYTALPPILCSEEWWLQRDIEPTNEVPMDGWDKPEPVDQRISIRAIDPPPGYRRYGELSPHMCATMAVELNDVRVMVAYLPHTREYGLRILMPGELMDSEPNQDSCVPILPLVRRRTAGESASRMGSTDHDARIRK